MVVTFVPAGFEGFFDEVFQLAADRTSPPPPTTTDLIDRMIKAAPKYGLETLPPALGCVERRVWMRQAAMFRCRYQGQHAERSGTRLMAARVPVYPYGRSVEGVFRFPARARIHSGAARA